MSEPLIVGLGGSLQRPSTSLAALRLALAGAEGAGACTRLLDVRELDLPMYAPGDGAPRAAQAFAEKVAQADGMIWSSPLYHGTISGAFKNALDWLDLLGDRDPPYLADKAIGLISTAGGSQGLQAINTMEFVVRALRGLAVPLVVPVPQAQRAFDAQGGALEERIAKTLCQLGQEVVRLARRLHG